MGATRYTEFGETHFLKPGDRSIVVLYDGEMWSAGDIQKMALDPNGGEQDGISILNQFVEPPLINK